MGPSSADSWEQPEVAARPTLMIFLRLLMHRVSFVGQCLVSLSAIVLLSRQGRRKLLASGGAYQLPCAITKIFRFRIFRLLSSRQKFAENPSRFFRSPRTHVRTAWFSSRTPVGVWVARLANLRYCTGPCAGTAFFRSTAAMVA